MAAIPDELQAALRARTVVPFVGAGLSLTLGEPIFPDWKGLLERFALRLDREAMPDRAAEVRRLVAAGDLVAAAEYAVTYLTKSRYTAELIAAFDRKRPPRVNLSAVEAVWRLQPKLVITTNFDRVLEWPFQAPSDFPYDPPAREAKVGDNSNAWFLSQLEQNTWDDDAVIWHLHGTITRPDSIVLTTSDFSALYGPDDGQGDPAPQNENARRVLSQMIGGRPLLFIGFSLSDPYLLNQLRRLLRLTRHNNPVNYLFIKQGQKDPTALLAEFNIQAVEFEDFGEKMVSRLNELVAIASPNAALVSAAAAPALAPLISDLEGRCAGLAPEPEFVAQGFNACKPDGWPAFPPSGDGVMLLRAAIARLAGAARQSSGGHPLLMFVAALADEHDAHRAPLRAWIESAIDALTEDAADRDRLRSRLALPGDAPPQPPYVLVRVLSVTGEKAWSVQAWLFQGAPSPAPMFDDERSYELSESDRLVGDLLDAMARHHVSADDAVVAFLLPRHLLREEIHKWRPTGPFGAEPAFGATYAVTIRSLERARVDRLRTMVEQQWRSLCAAQGGLQFVDLATNAAPPAPAAIRITAAVRGSTGLAQRLRQWGISYAVVAHESGAGPQASVVDSVLQAGVPVILLVRDADALSDDDSRALEELIAADPLLELPRRLRARRSDEEQRAEEGLGCRVALLWDAAEYLPPDQDPDNRLAPV